MRRAAFFALVLSLGAAARPALAAEDGPRAETPRVEPPVEIALISGAATAILPMVLGFSFVAAQSTTADGPRDVGFVVSGVGLALSPIVAHVVLGEYKRAAVFGAIPAAAEIAMCVYVTAMPDAVFHGSKGSRTGFGALYSVDIFGAAVGMVDALMVRERAGLTRRRAPDLLGGITVAPRMGRDQAGIVLGGAF